MLDDLFFIYWICGGFLRPDVSSTRVKVYALSLSKVVSSLCIDVDSSFRTYITSVYR